MKRLRNTLALLALLCLGAGDWGYRNDSGMSVDRALERTTGRPDVVIAVTGSGIQWDATNVNGAALNAGELGAKGAPQNAAGEPCADRDCNGDRLFTIADYKDDARVTDRNANGILDPGDLILAFSDGVDDDANGYTDDICGWDFFGNDNNPADDGEVGHGTAQARAVTDACPNCRYLPIRTGDDAVEEANDLAQALIYAADAKARVAAAGIVTVDQTAFSKAAIDYAYRKNMLVVAAIGDTASRAHVMPATANHVLTAGGVRYDGADPAKATTFTQADGCSSYGPSLSVMASTTGCSRDAAARIAGIGGLVFSAAADAKIDVSAEEAIQLFRSQADAIAGTTNGFDVHVGYGRANAARMVDAVLAKRVPPEVDLVSPAWFTPVFETDTTDPTAPSSSVRILGRIAARYATLYDVAVQFAPGTQPAEADFRDIVSPRLGIPGATVTGGGATAIATLDPRQVDTGGDPDRAITIRVRVTGHYASGGDLAGEARRVITVTNAKNGRDPDLLPGFPLDLGASIEASPKLADVDGDGVRDIVVPDSAGRLHVFAQTSGKPAELTGFPYLARRVDGLNKDLGNADIPSYAAAPGYNGQDGVDPAIAREAIVQAPAVGDIDGDGKPEIVFATWPGTIYVVNSKGQDTPGWPQRLPLVHACPSQERCADALHRWARGTASAPVLADFDGDGKPEIVLTSFDGRVWAYDTGGKPKPGFPVALAPTRLVHTPAVVDLDGDGKREIIAGGGELNPTGPGNVYAINADGTIKPNWPISLPLIGSPISADFDGDGRADVVLAANGATPRLVGPATVLADDPDFAAFLGSPAVGDVDQDGVPDVIVSGGAPSLASIFAGSSPTVRPAAQHRVEIWSGKTGQPFGAIPIEDFAVAADHAIADLNGDEYPEIITGTGGYRLHAADACGREAAGFPKNTSGWLAGTAAVGDVDGDIGHRLEVVAGTREGYLFAWTTKGTVNGKIAWESFHHDNANTGALATPLAQGTRERAPKPLVCADLKPPAAETFAFEGGCGLVATRASRWNAVLAAFFVLALARRRRR